MCWKHSQASVIMYAYTIPFVMLCVGHFFFTWYSSILAMKIVSFTVDVSFSMFHFFRSQKQEWIFTTFLDIRIMAKRYMCVWNENLLWQNVNIDPNYCTERKNGSISLCEKGTCLMSCSIAVLTKNHYCICNS